jgi:hypothetical protein
VYKELIKRGGTLIRERTEYNQNDDSRFIRYNGKKIGIVTAGSIVHEIIWALGYYHGTGADIIICANNEKQGAFIMAEKKEKKENCIFFQKTKSNENDRNAILKLIEE